LRKMGYEEFLSAEIYPLPDPDTAARQTATFMYNQGLARPA
jgi:hypothetical protein